jgi:hypothetical protein
MAGIITGTRGLVVVVVVVVVVVIVLRFLVEILKLHQMEQKIIIFKYVILQKTPKNYLPFYGTPKYIYYTVEKCSPL